MIYEINKSAGVGRSSGQWKTNVPVLKRPEVTGTKTIGGVKYYTGAGNKLYVSEAFDKMFTAPGGIVKDKKFKG